MSWMGNLKMKNIDWEIILIMGGLPLMFFIFMATILYINIPDETLKHEKFKLCIEAGMEWRKGDCVKKKL